MARRLTLSFSCPDTTGIVAEVAGFTGTLAHERIEVEDTGVAAVRFKNGAMGVIEATTSAFPGLLKKTEIHGTEAHQIARDPESRHADHGAEERQRNRQGHDQGRPPVPQQQQEQQAYGGTVASVKPPLVRRIRGLFS